MESSVRIMSATKVRFIANFPLSVVYGGFEHQCVQTCIALKSIGVDAELLKWHDAKQDDYILHLFAADPMWARIVENWGHRSPVVISAIAGARGFRRSANLIKNSLGYIAQLMRQETIFFRTRTLLHQVDKIICLNRLEQDFFVRSYDLPPEKTVIISNGVDSTRFSTPGNIFTDKFAISEFVLYVGNIILRKNPLLVAECLNELGLKGVFIGQQMSINAEYGKMFENIIATSPNLMWIPNFDYDDPLLSSAFSAAKVLCLPSVSETQPLVALEAMAAGTPVILGNYPYAYQTPFEKTIKVNPANKEELKTAIKTAVTQSQSAIEKLSLQYDWKKIAAKMAAVYSEIL